MVARLTISRRSRWLLLNAKKPATPRIDPSRLDPSRTSDLRRTFVAVMQARFKRLVRAVRAKVEIQDCFGLKDPPQRTIVINGRIVRNFGEYKFLTTDAKVKSFNQWFKGQVDTGILDVQSRAGADPETPWTEKYVGSAYRRGAVRSFVEARPQLQKSAEFQLGTQQEFLRDAFSQPERLSKLKLLGTRSFENLKGISADMSAKISSTLAEGIGKGLSPRDIARTLAKEVDGISRKRALVLARTEIIHAHSEGQLDSLEDLGIDEVGALVEWQTAGDNRVCSKCRALSGRVFKIKEARGKIPLHPQCRCAWVPVIDSAAPEEKPKPKPPKKEKPPVEEVEATQVPGITYSRKTVDPSKPLEVFGDEVRKAVGKTGLADKDHALRVGGKVYDKYQELLAKDTLARDKLMVKARTKFDEAWEVRRTELGKLTGSAREEIESRIKKLEDESQKLFNQAHKLRATSEQKRYQELMSNIRDMADPSDQPWTEDSSPEAVAYFRNIVDQFPKDWVQRSAATRRPLRAFLSDDLDAVYRIKDRPYYEHLGTDYSTSGGRKAKGDSHITVSNKRGQETGDSTAAHEFFHRMEATTPEIAKLEGEYYRSRTKDDPLVDLGGEAKGEMTREDKWGDHYMGKDYGGDAWEIGTMAIQGLLHSGPARTDTDALKFLFGLLSGV